MLDQFSSSGEKITKDTVRNMLGIPEENVIEDLISSVENGQSAEIINIIEQLTDQDTNPNMVAASLGKSLRLKLIAGQNDVWITQLLKELLDVAASSQAYETLEIILLEAASSNARNGSSNQTPKKTEQKDHKTENLKPKQSDTKSLPIKIEATESIKLEKNDLVGELNMNLWPEILASVKSKIPSLYTALKLSIPTIENNILTLCFEFPLHQKKVNTAAHKEVIANCIEEVAKTKVAIECNVDKAAFKNRAKKPYVPAEEVKEEKKEPAANIQTISNIFGTAEVLES
jgi:DNA polymerase III gamma/tau subunit